MVRKEAGKNKIYDVTSPLTVACKIAVIPQKKSAIRHRDAVNETV